jgi:hypothetical protein
MSVEKVAGISFAPSGAIHFSVIAIQNAYPGIVPTVQKNRFYYFYRHFASKGAAFMKKLRCVYTVAGFQGMGTKKGVQQPCNTFRLYS